MLRTLLLYGVSQVHAAPAETIQRQQQQECRCHVLEQAWDAGLLAQGGEVFTARHTTVEPLYDASSTASSMETGDRATRPHGLMIFAKDGRTIDQNFEHDIKVAVDASGGVSLRDGGGL
ncbi:hypothetical protein L3X38_042304 [Prunus dulcis]|uniref:Uncharacterized protein n=1 Tax=Prunus dulcis TaxID=3755 RepID=A0AAD4UUL4_PRUDU|nr:hypothetical protein L3X38_042304 [Prunus dulcis]